MNQDAQFEYARARALVQLRLDELKAALDRHARRWDEHEALARVERRLAALVEDLR